MSELAIETVEDSVAKMVGRAFTGAASASAEPEPEPEVDLDDVKFEFDEEFQTTIATLALRDTEFMRRAAHLLKPDYFESNGEAALVDLVLRYYERFKRVPDAAVVPTLIRDAVTNARMKKGDAIEVVTAFKKLKDRHVADRDYVEEKVAEFARHQAVSKAILSSVDLLSKGKFPQIEKAVKSAIEVGLNEDGEGYDYFAMIESRTEERLDEASGKTPPRGITTGVLKLDELLLHKGWGRKELSLLMGGAKSGKTTAMIAFAKNAALAGKNVLYVTLEVAARIIAERLDATISDNIVKELGKNIHDVRTKIEALQKKSGVLKLHEYPTGSFTPNQLRGLIERYKAKGIIFDFVVVDYLDIMAPNHRYNDPIENSKSIYVDMRGIAVEEGFAMLSATQTNREGFKSTVAKAEHVAEDFNRIRIADIVISINATEEERAKGEARLYFAASRNQEAGFTVFIKQNLAKMTFLESIIRIE
jgi:replicative DNA helicase